MQNEAKPKIQTQDELRPKWSQNEDKNKKTNKRLNAKTNTSEATHRLTVFGVWVLK